MLSLQFLLVRSLVRNFVSVTLGKQPRLLEPFTFAEALDLTSSRFQVPLWFQAVDDFNASQAGLRITPAIVASVTGSLTGGIIMQKTGKYYFLTIFAYLISSSGIVFVILFTGLVLNDTYGISVGLVLGGFGNGIGVTSTLIGMIANAKPEDQAIATACSYLFRSLGSTIGVSISATVFQQSLRMKLKNSLGSGKESDKIMKNVRQSLGYIESLRPEIQRLVRECYGLATRDSFFLMIGLALGATISSCKIHAIFPRP